MAPSVVNTPLTLKPKVLVNGMRKGRSGVMVEPVTSNVVVLKGASNLSWSSKLSKGGPTLIYDYNG